MANPLPPATSGQGLCFQLGRDHTFYRASPEPWTGPKESLRVLLLQPPARAEKSTAGSPGRDSQHHSCPQEPNETDREPVGTCCTPWKRTAVPSEHLQQLGWCGNGGAPLQGTTGSKEACNSWRAGTESSETFDAFTETLCHAKTRTR